MQNAFLFLRYRLPGYALVTTLAFLPISKAVVEIATTMAIVSWFLSFCLTVPKPPLNLPRSVFAGYLLFIAFVVISLASVSPAHLNVGLRGVVKWTRYLVIFTIMADLCRSKHFAKKVVWALSVSMLVVTINGFYQLWTGEGFLIHHTLEPGRIIRMTSSLEAPNNLAALFLLAVPLTFSSWVGRKEKNRGHYFSLLCFFLFSAAFILTFSRGAFIAIIASCLIYLISSKKFRFLWLLLLLVAMILGPSKKLRRNFLTSLNPHDITVGERVRMWKAGWDLVRKHFWFGMGANTYFINVPEIELDNGPAKTYAHNSYLQIWAEVGILGLAAFLFPLIDVLGPDCFFRRKRPDRAPPLQEALLIGLFAFCLQAAVDNNFFAKQPATLFWIFWGMYVGMKLKHNAGSRHIGNDHGFRGEKNRLDNGVGEG